MSFPPAIVARDVCGDIPPQIPINIDCSLCGLGWPQASGEIQFNLFRGTNCVGSDSGILGDYSYWLNGAYLPGRFQFGCRNPGPDAEPNPNEWVAGDEFSWGGTWRLDCVLTVLTKTRVKVDGSIRWLNPATKKLEVWTTFSKEMDEDNPQGITDPRRHRVFKSGRVAITPNAASGGVGDPVTGIEFVLGTRPLIIGCGTELCSMWDGDHYYTCFRAEVTDTGGLPRLAQMGKSQQPCGGRNNYGQYQPWCFCDRVTLLPNDSWRNHVNADPAFIQEYGPVGNPPLWEEQQIQIGGGLLMKRWGSGPTRIWTQDAQGAWVEGTWTVFQDFGPTIWEASFGSPVFRTARLYSLAFPNPGILPDACAPDPAPPGPDLFQWYCVDGTCIQSNVQPPNAIGGPYPSLFVCQGAKCEPPPPKKWYCVNNTCGEYEAAPTGATSGPHDTLAQCQAACQPPPPQSKWYCVSGNCIQADTMPPGATGGPYDTQAECQGVCQAPPALSWWCQADGTCIESATQPPGSTGPFSSQNECLGQCQPPATMVWICPANTGNQGTCIETTLQVAIDGGWEYWGSQIECAPHCQGPEENPYAGYYCLRQTNPDDGSYTCIQWGGTNGPPNGASGGKYDTLEECVAVCAPPPGPGASYWCVQSADIAVRQCAQSMTQPPATVSGPYPNLADCLQACTVIAEPTPSIAPPPPPQVRRAATLPGPLGNQQRYWLPCIHKGEEIPNSGFT